MFKALVLESFFRPKTSGVARFYQTKNKTASSLRFYFAFSLVLLNAALLMSYVYGVNKFSAVGYEIKQLQKQQAALTESSKKINLKISEATSMVTIQNNFLSSNFVPAGTPKFLEIRATAHNYADAGSALTRP